MIRTILPRLAAIIALTLLLLIFSAPHVDFAYTGF